MAREGLWLAYLFYGWGGSGKSFLGTSGMMNHTTGELLADGKWITFGREDNPRIRLPAAYRETKAGKSLSLRVPDLKSRQWLTDFQRVTERLLVAARKGRHLDFLFMDGFAEFDLIFERSHKKLGMGDQQWSRWADMLDEFYDTVQICDPRELGCHVIWSTRVADRKLGTFDKKVDAVVGADPEWLNTEYYPAVRGKFHKYLPHYFDMVLYCDQDTIELKDGSRQGVHNVHMLRTGDFFIKNAWDDEWLAAGLPERPRWHPR